MTSSSCAFAAGRLGRLADGGPAAFDGFDGFDPAARDCETDLGRLLRRPVAYPFG